MSLDNFRNRTIIWDTVNKDFPQPIQAMQGDVNARTLLIKIVDNGVEIDLTGHSLKLTYQYTNNGNSGFVIIPPKDLAKGEFILVIPTEMTTTGVIEANLILLNESLEQVIVSKSLTFISDNSTVTDLAQEVNNKIDDFTKLLLENMPQVMRSELNDLHAQTEANLSDIEVLQDSIAKIAEAQANSLPLNVKWFGAKGDGVTDDTLSIQRAIDTGFSVFIPPGKYNVKELKGFSSGQIIQGISKAESWGGKNTQNITLLNGIGSADNYVIKNNVWTDGILPTAITVKNLSIEGSKKTNGILVGNSSTIEGVKIQNCINGLSKIKVSNVMNCQINNCTNGVMTAVDSKITNNFFYYNEVGINFDNSNDNSIVNNKIEWNRIGISLTKATFNLISNNIIDRNTTYGIYTFNTANTTILGNQFERNLTNHLYLQGSQFNISTNSFFRKNSEDNQSGIMAPDIAIFAKSVSNSMITNNFVNGKMFNKTGTDYSSNVNYSANTIDGINPDNISISIPETTVAHDQDTKIIIPLPSYFDGALNNPYNVEIVSQKISITTQDGNFYSNGGIIKSIYMSKSGIELTIINYYKDDLKIAGTIKVRCVYPSLY